MIGVYINFNNPFGKHFIGTSNTIEGACAIVKEQTKTNKNISIPDIRNTLSVTESYYQEIENGQWFVITETSHKDIPNIRRVPL